MYRNLKYIYSIPVFMACMLASCNSDMPGSEVVDMGAELSFATYEPSRASSTPAFDKFAVYGDIKSTKNINASPLVIFNNKEVEFIDGKWRYDGTQYWVPNYEHSFVAVTPNSVLEPDAAPVYSGSQLSFTYSIPAPGGILAHNSDATDILIATHRRVYVDNDADATFDNKITLKFSHLLTQINIAPAFYDNNMSSDDYILFRQLEISGIYTKARFDISPAPRLSNSQTDDMTVDMTRQEKGNLTIVFTTPVKVENNSTNVKLFADDDAVIMIPQDFAAGSDATITLSYSINDDTSIKRVNLPLSNLKWESANSYIYNFTVEMTGVKLEECEINPWNVIEGEEITVD